MRQLLKALKTGAFLFVVTVVMLEILLRVTDPLGLRVEYDKAAMTRIFTEDVRGYGYSPGTHRFSQWTMTIGSDGNRITPDRAENGTMVYFIGDSVTVGWGVEDNQTYVNLLAHDLQLNAVNRAVNGYNMPNIVRTLRGINCQDCIIVYLMIGNDGGDTYQLGNIPNTAPMLLSYYLRPNPQRAMKAQTTPTEEMFWGNFTEVVNDRRVQTFAFDDVLTQEAVQRGYPVNVIPDFTHSLSHVDPHPDAAGHREIAAEIKPYLIERLYGSSIER